MAAETEARAKLVEEHVLAEVEHDVERIMRTWGRVTLVRRCAWNEQSYGRDEVREHYEELLMSFRDLAIDVKARHVTDDAVILEVVVSGTHLGPWRDLPPLERWMESRVCAVYTFDEQGLLELERTYYDKAEVLEQLGISRTRASRSVACWRCSPLPSRP